jgi:hypothetical protein
MRSKAILDEVKQAAVEAIECFNRSEIAEPRCYYVAQFKGRFLYLGRLEYGRLGPICRLTYNGDLNRWAFAIYKYSDNAYDPDEWFFPGSEHVDGTIEGAMRAGLKAYPC